MLQPEIKALELEEYDLVFHMGEMDSPRVFPSF